MAEDQIQCYEMVVEREEIDSRAIRSIGYDPISETLEIEFRSGRVYAYEKVPSSVHDWLRKIRNKGAFVTRVLEPKFHGREVHAETPTEIDLEAALRASLDN